MAPKTKNKNTNRNKKNKKKTTPANTPQQLREKNRLRMREKRAEETVNQQKIRQKKDRERASASKQTKWANFKLETFNDNKNIDYRLVTGKIRFVRKTKAQNIIFFTVCIQTLRLTLMISSS